jgi:branched-chain amino acid transport system ATP-binding protein
MLTLENVSKSFGHLKAVNRASMHVPKGSIVGLIGPNGSGKSTLLNVISGSLKPDEGSIRFDSEEIGGRTPEEIFAQGIVRSFQDPSLFFRMTALDNTLLPVKDQKGEKPVNAPFHRLWRAQEKANALRAAAVLKELQLGGHYERMASELSGGQMKLLELGRSLMGAPKMLLLDEPTAGVAPALAYQIFEEIDRLRNEQGITILIVEHRLDILFDYADKIFVMYFGQVIAEGTPLEIEANDQVREIYFGE